MEVCAGKTQDLQIQNDLDQALVQALLQGHGSLHGTLSPTLLIIGRLLLVLEADTATALALDLLETLHALMLLLGQLPEEVSYASKTTSSWWK